MVLVICNGLEECREITSIHFPEETTENDVNHMQDMYHILIYKVST